MNREELFFENPTATELAWQNKLTETLPHQELTHHNNELAEQSYQLQQDLKARSCDLDFLDHKDWDLLTILKNFDQATFEHSIKTYEIAKEKIERPLVNGTLLKKLIEAEGINLETFYRACLLHDIGKTIIPLELLNSKITETEWASQFIDKLPIETQEEIFNTHHLERPELNNEEAKNQAIHVMIENDLRAVKFVPLKFGLPPETAAALKIQDIDLDLPLFEILKKHEAESERILTTLGYGQAAELAGAHHGYQLKTPDLLNEKPASVTSLRISVMTTSIIHLADVQEALESQRAYHVNQPIINILAILVHQAQEGRISAQLTAEWIYDEYSKIGTATINNIRNKTTPDLTKEKLADQYTELQLVEKFLAEHDLKIEAL